MPRFLNKSEKKAGSPPGLEIESRSTSGALADICVINYSKDSLETYHPADIDATPPLIEKEKTAWIQVTGIHDHYSFSRMGELFNIHTLTLEDMVNPAHPPKFEDFDNYFYVTLKQMAFNPDNHEVSETQVSIAVMENLIIFVQDKPSPCLKAVEKRLEAGRKNIRTAGPGYLAYALIDAVVDHSFDVIGQIAEAVESVERDMLEELTPEHLEQIHRLKREVIFFKKQLRPVRGAILSLIKSESPLIPDADIRFYADVLDHVNHILDVVSSLQELLSSMLDYYMSAQGNRMNEVMATLTIISTIFIPLSFLAGIYGMNFKFMPELEWQWGYFTLLGGMVVIGGAMVVYFKRKGWF
ncbi:magnesium/cobalt transporter CorA [uncultured Desulfobacter sp.]|uniref:magnesium/cobalt transporter CorA n=1 Tax=uncultured Desulfobacter sp. TaxID=240139 RepID=UPI002AAB51E2|nr:magnesium/cobalt transporter CorA [uncultured Desulfobacter sp.]